MKIYAAALLGGLVGACATVPEGAPGFVRDVDVEYSKFGACAFNAMDRIWPNQIRLVDLRGEDTIRVFMEVTTNGPFGVLTVRQIEISARKIAAGRSRVEVSTRALTSSEQAWGRVSFCAQPS